MRYDDELQAFAFAPGGLADPNPELPVGESGYWVKVASDVACSLQVRPAKNEGSVFVPSGVSLVPQCALLINANRSGVSSWWRVAGVRGNGSAAWAALEAAVVAIPPYRHLVRFVKEQRTEVRGGGGTIAAVDGPEVWANVVPLNVRERTEAAGMGQVATHRVEIRFRGDLAPYRLIRHAGRILEIRGTIDVEERGEELHLTCEERR
jgi:SPP1 family predicted phage head-tail adaptor